MNVQSFPKIIGEFVVGPRKVSEAGHVPIVYLGRDFRGLVGRKVILIVKVLEGVDDAKSKPH